MEVLQFGNMEKRTIEKYVFDQFDLLQMIYIKQVTRLVFPLDRWEKRFINSSMTDLISDAIGGPELLWNAESNIRSKIYDEQHLS